MNSISGISYYDALTKLLVGLLLVGWIPLVFPEAYQYFRETICNMDCDLLKEGFSAIDLTYGIVICYVAGTLWHHGLIEQLKCFKDRFVNNEDALNKAYRKVYGKEPKKSLDASKNPNPYYKAFYSLDENGKLSLTHILEAIEAFMRDTLLIFILYALGILFFAAIEVINYSAAQACFFSVSILLLDYGWYKIHNEIMVKVHVSVIEWDFYKDRIIERYMNN